MKMNFGKLENKYSLGDGSFAEYYSEVCEREYFDALSEFVKNGYEKAEENEIGKNSFTVLTNGLEDVYASFYPTLNEACVVREPHGKYLEFRDTPRTLKQKPLMIQVDLEDFGESVVFRLPDGRFIVFDGGREFMPDADKLYGVLSSNSCGRTPTVAAWILTHPHCDHYKGAVVALEKYGDKIDVQSFVYSFPDLTEENIKRIPRIDREREYFSRLDAVIKKSGASVIKAHTGQIFDIGGARMEMLFTPDDVKDGCVEDINSLSLVVKLTVAGQSIMMCADCMLPEARLAEKYGEYLKCDILQPAHHMFIGGDIPTYRLMSPETVVVPSFEEDVFARISPFQNISKKENLFLLYDLGVGDFFTGSRGDVVLELPYTPRPHGRELYLEKLREYKRGLGSDNWYFSGITKDDAVFSFLNTTVECATVYADLYFEGIEKLVRSIKITVPRMVNYKFNILDGDGDALFYNPHALAKKGVPDGESFTVNFKSDIPIVISGKKPADYHA